MKMVDTTVKLTCGILHMRHIADDDEGCTYIIHFLNPGQQRSNRAIVPPSKEKGKTQREVLYPTEDLACFRVQAWIIMRNRRDIRYGSLGRRVVRCVP